MTTVLKLKFANETGDYLAYAAAIQGTTVEKLIGALAKRNDIRELIEESAYDVVKDYERRHNLPSSFGSMKASEAELNQCWQHMVANRAALGA